ncbi:response regulator [Kineosporia sp. NBRC 101731]|uniref:response regulator n=1 Tax=Kineosporia sp. NBRC 101731 TaxID=3032199 RepID=UPI0024A06CAC|nr:response regulator [Kineosporia sp. NBRC 101731]GLY27347.1 response regulator [Kineosporia sp. NBRC 101731]
MHDNGDGLAGGTVVTQGHTDWILLVDDSAEDRELLQHTLRRNKFHGRVEEARDGLEAIDRLCCRGRWADSDPNDLPRAIFLDVKMPRMSGVEVLRELRSVPQLAVVPVVMLTSSAEERDILDSYALGANSYVVKPVDMDEYFRSIADVGRYWVALNRTPTEYPRANTTAPAGR